ncbi:uncharacterized protein B0P05DRAFT_587825 [Gilbertella persicaria]|uniref:uncharacterized protein n=1 Tax=Gilbertella persicaria TaxID=101096 RepID=UPI00221EA932|nr:uncharacterized protein B0P05DRAFT_587825 [Gilbertella persicaria]KAI8077361.1 hypothetical protein B0P05DRAFT_587825 [Gilbertella persicaria]
MAFPTTAFFLATAYFISMISLGKSKRLIITNPMYGARLKRGELTTISWDMNSCYGSISILLMVKSATKSQKIMTIAVQDASLEYYDWMLPKYMPPGTQYFIAIEDSLGVSYSRPFSILE